MSHKGRQKVSRTVVGKYPVPILRINGQHIRMTQHVANVQLKGGDAEVVCTFPTPLIFMVRRGTGMARKEYEVDIQPIIEAMCKAAGWEAR
jgi:hypothetical protein